MLTMSASREQNLEHLHLQPQNQADKHIEWTLKLGMKPYDWLYVTVVQLIQTRF